MAKPRDRLVDYLAYLGVRLFAAFVHMFPLEANYRTARWIGDLLFRFDRRHRQRGMEHLKRSFPDWSEQHCREVCRESMRNVVYLGLEVLFTPRLITPGRWRRHIVLTEMGPFVRLLLERRTGLIVLTGHYGNWEVAGYTLAALGFPCCAVARPLDNPYLNRFLLGVRQDKGMVILDKKGATENVGRILEERGVVAFVADQDAGRKGLFVDFFGRPASTYKSIALLAMQYNVPVAVNYGRRRGGYYRFEIGCTRIIFPQDWADRDDPLRWITQEYTRALEDLVRSTPEQYLWVHRRWKHRPKGEEPGPDGVA